MTYFDILIYLQNITFKIVEDLRSYQITPQHTHITRLNRERIGLSYYFPLLPGCHFEL